MPRIPARSLRATLLATALAAAVALPATAAPYPPRSRTCSIYPYRLEANGKGGVIGANGTIRLCRDGVTNTGSFVQLGQGIGTVRFEMFPQTTFGTNRLYQDAGGPVDTGFVQKGRYTSARITVCTVGAPSDECVHGDYRNRFVRAPGRP
jgi:hypothetical protein